MATSPWAHLVVGGPILADSFFGNGFDADFTKDLDGGLNAGGILGTTPGYDGDPFNFTYPTDGQFKVGGHLQFHQNYATGYNYPHSSDQRNKEPQHIPHFHGGNNPDPMSFFEKRDGKLVLKARAMTETEQLWARVKGYAIMENGREATYDWFDQNGGVPLDWIPNSSTGVGTEAVYFQNMPASYSAPMISTYNRASMSFGRHCARMSMPTGAKATGNTFDLNNVETWFPAFWTLEDVPAKCDINGRLHDKDTYTPGNPAAGSNLTECDPVEIFGYEPYIHITSHHYKDGYGGYNDTVNGIAVRRGTPIQTNHTPPYPNQSAGNGVFFEGGVDHLPPFGDEPGKYVYHVNGIVIAIYDMPTYVGQPKILYEPVDGVAYLPTLNDDYTVKRLGSQVYEDGNPAYQHNCQIFNIAMSAAFTRSQAVTNLNAGTAPSFAESEEMIIEWTQMRPLIDENPDTKPFIDYKEGEFGGSSSTLQGEVTDNTRTYVNYDIIAERPNGGYALIPSYVGATVTDVTIYTSDSDEDIDIVARNNIATNTAALAAVTEQLTSAQIEITRLSEGDDWDEINDNTTFINSDKYFVGELTTPLTINQFTILDGQQVRIIDLVGHTTNFPLTLDLGGTVTYSNNGSPVTEDMPLVLNDGAIDILLIRNGDNWLLGLDTPELD